MPTFTGTYTPHAGDQFIFKGGDTWGNANFPVVDAAGGGTSAHPDYYGVDPTWYDGSSWSRPIFDADSQNITGADPRASGEQDIFFDLRRTDYVTVDDIEFLNWTASNITGGYGSCAVVELDGDAHVTIDRILVTGLSIDASGNSDTCAVAFGDTQPPYGGSSVLENSTITGDGTTYGFGAWSIGNIENNTISGIPSMVYPSAPVNGSGTVSGNLLYNCSIPPAATNLHADTILVDVTGNPSTLYIHDNVIHDTHQSSGGECESMWFGNPGETDYVWNNVMYNLGGSGEMKVSNNNGNTTSGTEYIWNNSLSGAFDGGTDCITGHPGVSSTAVTIENNLCVTSASSMLGTFYCISGGSSCVTADHNLQLTPAQFSNDISAGLFSSSPFEYAPTGAASPGVASGANLSTSCAGSLALLCSDTTYGGGRTPLSRPANAGWDIGAY